jgi:hypothetical protein
VVESPSYAGRKSVDAIGPNIAKSVLVEARMSAAVD